MTYDELNDLVHEVAESIEEAADLKLSPEDRQRLNDVLSDFLQDRGVEFCEEWEGQ